MGERITYQADGLEAIGYLAVPDGDGLCPGVLLCHEGPGQDAHVRGRADRIAAELGCVAFALDYHGGGVVLPDMAAVMGRLGPLRNDHAAIRRLGQAGLDQLTAHPRVDTSKVAVIGYCFGGTMALELARAGADVKAAVGFHSGLSTANAAPADNANITAKVLVCVGDNDPLIPVETVIEFEAAMRTTTVDWQVHRYGGVGHSFTNTNASALGVPGVAYDVAADHRSWNAMVGLFRETILA